MVTTESLSRNLVTSKPTIADLILIYDFLLPKITCLQQHRLVSKIITLAHVNIVVVVIIVIILGAARRNVRILK